MNRARFVVFRRFDAAAFTTVLCDADGNLFPSEEPAFTASVEVTNEFLDALWDHRPLHRR